jgi:glutamate-1-semialdehyde 2,1-aminomutase
MLGQDAFKSSEALFRAAKEVIPGGVNSPVRAFGSVGMHPLFIKKAKGARVWDEDGNTFVDYVGSWGPAILGHAHPEVVKAVAAALPDGFSFGAPTRLETELVKAVRALVPHAVMLRLVSSGTEACMSVLRLARARTGRKKILKFVGCYHGHADMLLVKAGSGVATLGIPGSPGVPEEATQFTLTAGFNDLPQVAEIFRQHGDDLAAVIVEPIVGNAGFIRPQPGFHEGLRALCDRHGSLLIFDEVMTGFRVALGGFQAITSVTPDLMTFGKVIGGGMPIAAYGGRRDIMEQVAPAGPMYQAGTLSGNPIAVACGLKTLELVKASDWSGLGGLTRRLVEGLCEEAAKLGIPFSADSEGGMFGFFFRSKLPANFAEASDSDTPRFVAFFQGMLRRGVYLAPSAFEAGFVSFAHTTQDIDQTIMAARDVMKTL